MTYISGTVNVRNLFSRLKLVFATFEAIKFLFKRLMILYLLMRFQVHDKSLYSIKIENKFVSVKV